MSTNFITVEVFLDKLNTPYTLIKAKKLNNSYSFEFVIESKDILRWYDYFSCLCQHELIWEVKPNRLNDTCQVLKISGLKI
jgi:hypothetical protein